MMKMIEMIIKHQTLRYLICGAVATLLGIVVFWLCERAYFHVAVSNTISTIAVVFFAYIINKIFVFQSKFWSGVVLAREIFTFITGRFAMYVAETVALILLVDLMNFPGFYCKLFTTMLVVVGNYLISKKAVFIK